MVWKNETDALQEIVQIANESKNFYEVALTKIYSAEVKNVFERMIKSKQELVGALSPHIIARKEAPDLEGSFLDGLRRTYADVLASLSSNEDAIYASQLEETEDRLLEHFRDALSQVQSVELTAVLKRYLPEVQACHEEMRRLKHRLNP